MKQKVNYYSALSIYTLANKSIAVLPLSALAARRLRSHETVLLTSKTPETERNPARVVNTSKDAGLGISATASTTSTGSEGMEDLKAKRREIERTLKDQFKTQARIQSGVGFCSSGIEDSTLTMARRGSGEGASLEMVDGEMVDVGELVELGGENGRKPHARNYSGERSITRASCIWEKARSDK